MISDNFEAIRELDILQIRATKERIISYLLQLASFCKRHTVQTRAPAEGIYRDRPDTRRDLYALDVTAPEPAVSDSFCALWDDNFLAIPEVPNTHTVDHRIWKWANLCGIWYLKIRELCLASVLDVDALKIGAVSERVPPQLL